MRGGGVVAPVLMSEVPVLHTYGSDTLGGVVYIAAVFS